MLTSTAANTAPVSEFNPRTAIVAVGQRLISGGYRGEGHGTIIAIRGDQQPATVRKLGLAGAMVMTGGSASFDIVYDDGSRSHAVPESIVRSLPYTLLPEVISADDVAAKVAYAECVAAIAKKTFKAECERLKSAPEYVGYEIGRYRDTAVKNMRKELKRAFPKVKFSVVQQRGGSSISVRWTGGPEQREVEAVAYKFKEGSFNGMTDSYEFSRSRSPWTSTFGGAQYISCSREEK